MPKGIPLSGKRASGAGGKRDDAGRNAQDEDNPLSAKFSLSVSSAHKTRYDALEKPERTKALEAMRAALREALDAIERDRQHPHPPTIETEETEAK